MLAEPAGPADPRALAISRRQCFDQIRLLEQRKREIETALAELRRTYSSFYARLAAVRRLRFGQHCFICLEAPPTFVFRDSPPGTKAMPTYRAPVEDVQFLLNDVFHIDQLCQSARLLGCHA